MIELVTGNPGDGKSYFSVRKVVDGLKMGKCVGTNVPLVDDFCVRVARKHLVGSSARPRAVAVLAAKYRSRLYVSDDFGELLRLRVDPGDSMSEELMFLVIDEAHEAMNARTWNTAVQKSTDEATVARLKIVKEMATHRHKRMRVFLVTQHQNNVDAQVRALYGVHTKVRNLKRLPFWPFFNFFVAVSRLSDETKTRVSVSAYFLRKSYASSYDSFIRGRRENWPDDVIVLPRFRVGHGADGPRRVGAEQGQLDWPAGPPAPARPARTPLSDPDSSDVAVASAEREP